MSLKSLGEAPVTLVVSQPNLVY